MNKKKLKIWICLGIILLLICSIFIFFYNNTNKIENLGNNINSKTAKEIEEYILSICSYEAEIEVKVNSNKNSNSYIIRQSYVEPNIAKQEVIEPSNIQGLQTIYDGNQLKIFNSKLQASTIYENYPYLAENDLWLSSFCKDYKENDKSVLKEEQDKIYLETTNGRGTTKILVIDKKAGKPIELKVQDRNEKNTVYILYKEIKVNGLKREEILAFTFQELQKKLS